MTNWTRVETAKLLSVIGVYDDRNLGTEAHMLAWTQAGQYGRWELEFAIEAVHQHHLHSTELIKPAHVNAHVQSAKNDRDMREKYYRLAGPVDGEMRAYIERNWRKDAALELSLLEVPCPFEGCRVDAAKPCVLGGVLAGRRKRHQPHPGRHVALYELATSRGLDPSWDGPECPACGAQAGIRCMNLGRGSYLADRLNPHVARLEKAS